VCWKSRTRSPPEARSVTPSSSKYSGAEAAGLAVVPLEFPLAGSDARGLLIERSGSALPAGALPGIFSLAGVVVVLWLCFGGAMIWQRLNVVWVWQCCCTQGSVFQGYGQNIFLDGRQQWESLDVLHKMEEEEVTNEEQNPDDFICM